MEESIKESSKDQIRKNQKIFEPLAGVIPAVTREKPFARELSRAIESSWEGCSVKSKGAGQLEIKYLYKGITRLDKEPNDYIVREMIPCNGGEEEEKEKSAGTGLQKIQSPVSPLSTPLNARIFYHLCRSCFTSFSPIADGRT